MRSSNVGSRFIPSDALTYLRLEMKGIFLAVFEAAELFILEALVAA